MCFLFGFKVFLPGDQTAVASTHFNSLYGPSGYGSGPVSLTYSSMTQQTTIAFKTTPMDPPIGLAPGSGMVGAYGGDNAVPHFGLSAEAPGETTGGELIPPLMMEWSYGSGLTLTVPTVGVGIPASAPRCALAASRTARPPEESGPGGPSHFAALPRAPMPRPALASRPRGGVGGVLHMSGLGAGDLPPSLLRIEGLRIAPAQHFER